MVNTENTSRCTSLTTEANKFAERSTSATVAVMFLYIKQLSHTADLDELLEAIRCGSCERLRALYCTLGLSLRRKPRKSWTTLT